MSFEFAFVPFVLTPELGATYRAIRGLFFEDDAGSLFCIQSFASAQTRE